MASHGANAVAGEKGPQGVRVYFNCRDQTNRSSVAWLDLNLEDPLSPRVSVVSPAPVLGPGELGSFDDSGTSIGSLVSTDEGLLLYYLGWSLGVSVPWHNCIGVAILRPGSETLERLSRAPIMDRSEEDPFTISYPCVRKESGLWHMWYGSHTRWGGSHEFEHELRYASSDDGLAWRRNPAPLITPLGPSEYAFSRPTVVQIGDSFVMLFCSRGDRYRIYRAVYFRMASHGSASPLRRCWIPLRPAGTRT